MILPCDGVQLLPTDRWWAAWWWADEHWIGVDICTPPQLRESTWHYVDLELDMVLLRDGTVETVDQDELDQAVWAGAIPRETADQVFASAAWVQQAMSGKQEPFSQAGWRWLAAAQRSADVHGCASP